MTELAYLSEIDAGYVRSFRARVTARPPGGVVLDRTFFYAAGGGQPADHGTLGIDGGPGLAVVNVSKSGPSVVHQLRGTAADLALLSVGREVAGTLDWERRYRHMRLHTAQHFLSARVFDRCGRRTSRAVLEGTTGHLDLEADLPEGIERALAEDLAEAVRSPRSVRVVHVPRSEWLRDPAPRSGLVPLAAQIDPVRLIEIDGCDRCPCGGTHLRSTAEIGETTLAPPRASASGVRLSFSLGRPGPNPTA